MPLPAHPHAGRGGERGDVGLGWLTRLTVSLTLLALVGFDAVSLGAARFQAEDHAQTAARAAAESYQGSRDVQRSYDAALAAVAPSPDTIDVESYLIGPDGSVTLRLRRQVPTLLVEKVPALRDWATVTRTVTSRAAA